MTLHSPAQWLLRLALVLAVSICSMTAHADMQDDIRTLTGVLFHINARYVDTVDVDALTEAAVRAMLKELDPHSTYLTPAETRQMREGLDGGFEGIGVSYQMVEDTLLVIKTIAGGPSERAGILPCDQIVQCGDSTIAGCHLSIDDIKRRLRGPLGSEVRLGVKRQGEPDLLWFDIVRDKIPVLSIDTYYMATPTVGYICIERFGQTTAEELSAAMEALTALGMEDVIIDLQGNGGGYLGSAVDMASVFLPSNKTVVYTQGRSETRHEYITRNFSNNFTGRVVVLIDEQSASASEIFSGCMQDLDRGVIVGRRSFGKGLVQRPIELPNGGLIRLTVSHYYTPSGRCIQKPYTKGDQQSYQQDIANRLRHGELQSADSIRVADSLRYTTHNGRTVYGGGGIIPDVFVPYDSTRLTPAHRAVISHSSINKYTIRYFRQNQAFLHMQFPSLEDFLDEESGFDLSDEIVQGVIDQAKSDSVTTEGLDSLIHNDLFRLQVLAFIANNLYDTGSYRQVMNQSSAVVSEALAVLADDRRYRTLLGIQ